jgi:hypothetical protein
MHSSLFKFIFVVNSVLLFGRVPARYIRDFSLFYVCSSGKNSPSARCASAAKVVCRDLTYFEPKLFLLIMFYKCIFLVIKILIVLSINIL